MSSLFRPPALGHTIGVLDRALFSKTVNLAAATIADNKKLAQWRKTLEKDSTLLRVERLSSIVPHPDHTLASKGSKCLLLDPKVRPGAPDTWSAHIRDAVQNQALGIVPYDLFLGYDYWTYEDVIRCLIPPNLDSHDGAPAGFNQAGHVAHLNLREAFLPYKKVIAEVIVDKNANIRTVINKIADVGRESEFRTFNYEVLAGPEDLIVEARENDCVFGFNYAKVYWNSKLEGEHSRLVKLFQPGEVICDVMAGIGPFAIPAGKKDVFVWANDYNPESYRYLAENIRRNKVSQHVRPFNEDGRTFITKAADMVYAASTSGEKVLTNKAQRHQQRSRGGTNKAPPTAAATDSIPIPPTISHFVMNLPASAITFLPYYRGLYIGHESLFGPSAGRKLPMVHVHCFAEKAIGDGPLIDVCKRISAELGVSIKPGNAETPGEATVLEVRDVSPKKRMFCASFRLPPEVAFAPRP
ncbi:Met-10+ like-protein-domain-containing protein [Xylariaceae sp. FL1272]|nr:Met-10+ like-protein-domain-containing protein [Xylariaceae sp. FL1272]